MDFIDQIKQLSEKVAKWKDQIKTEEATKTSFILPMLQTLGYDVSDPTEIVPEYVPDYGAKKGERVDYAVLQDGVPVILIECKQWAEDLLKHNEQLYQYFTISKAKFGILTNGIQYFFFTDLVDKNIMDKEPFFVFDISDIHDNDVDELKKFHKSYFQIDTITNTAAELKYSNLIRAIFISELKKPTDDFVKYFMDQVFDKKATQAKVIYFSDIVRKSINQVISDQITERLKSALVKENESAKVKPSDSEPSQKEITAKDGNTERVPNEKEVEAYYILKSILRTKVLASRVFLNTQKNSASIVLDDSQKRYICYLYLTTDKMQLGTIDDLKKETKHEILSLDDIYKHSEALAKAIDLCEKPGN